MADVAEIHAAGETRAWKECPLRAEGCRGHVRATTYPGDRPPTVEGSCADGVKATEKRTGQACRGACAAWRRWASKTAAFPEIDLAAIDAGPPPDRTGRGTVRRLIDDLHAMDDPSTVANDDAVAAWRGTRKDW